MIQIHELSKSYRETRAIDRLSLEVSRPGTLAILGPSGSGKTTLLRLIAGLEMPDQGEIRINGELVSTPDMLVAPSRRNLGFVFQSPALWPHLNVAQHILFGLVNPKSKEARNRLEEMLEAFALKGLEQRYPYQLSGGEARRVSLARSLAPQPICLLMDEPLTNLDPDLKQKLLSYIKETTQINKTCLIYVTHDEIEAQLICRNIRRIKKGALI